MKKRRFGAAGRLGIEARKALVINHTNDLPAAGNRRPELDDLVQRVFVGEVLLDELVGDHGHHGGVLGIMLGQYAARPECDAHDFKTS